VQHDATAGGSRDGSAARDDGGEGDGATGPGSPALVATNLGWGASIVTDSANVYWLDWNEVWRTPDIEGHEVVGSCPLGGCPGAVPTTFGELTVAQAGNPGHVDGIFHQLAVVADEAYFTGFTGTDASTQGALYESATTAGAAGVYVTSTDSTATYVTDDGTYVYWVEQSADAVYRCATGSGCTSPTLVAGLAALVQQPKFAGIAVADGLV
jgi:hypothetical protein